MVNVNKSEKQLVRKLIGSFLRETGRELRQIRYTLRQQVAKQKEYKKSLAVLVKVSRLVPEARERNKDSFEFLQSHKDRNKICLRVSNEKYRDTKKLLISRIQETNELWKKTK